jgi:ubiquinone/menaquinone biosynthesis C-methylase UbiE
MSTDWSNTELATDFDTLQGATEREVGFPNLFSHLRLDHPDVNRLLDYGCGPGKTAQLIAELHEITITAVDTSPEMLRIATTDHAHPAIQHRPLRKDKLAFLDDSSIDAAMSCFLFINIADETELREIATEVHRVLRPGGRYVTMDSNPDATGIRFASFQTGEPSRTYETGELRRVQLYNPDGHTLELNDYHWPTTTYQQVFRDAGFRTVRFSQPKLQRANHPADPTSPPTEAIYSPLLLVTGEK